MSSQPPTTIADLLSDRTTVLSFSLVLALIVSAYVLSLATLRRGTSSPLRFLFIWHAFDALIHFIFEGSYLYNALFTYVSLPSFASAAPNWLGYTDRLYGSNFGGPENHLAALWRVYAQADSRWGGADATVVSIELLTVLLAGPVAAYIAVLIARGDARASIWMVALAVAELYGGFMTFAPEWLTGSQSLDTSNWVFTWVYLFFFNTLWVWIPIYAIYVSYKDISNAFDVRTEVIVASEEKQKKEESKKSRANGERSPISAMLQLLFKAKLNNNSYTRRPVAAYGYERLEHLVSAPTFTKLKSLRICTEVLYQPLTLLDCLHTFCGACLKEWFAFQLNSARASGASSSSSSSSSPVTCPSCRAVVRATKNNATVTTLLEMFLAANPDKGRTVEEKEEVKKKYTPGDDVMPKAEEREKTLRERMADDDDGRLIQQVQMASLREVGVELPEERRERRRRREERARASGRTSSRTASRDASNDPAGSGPERERRRAEDDSGSESRRRREERAAASASSPTTLHPESTRALERRRRRSEEAARRSQDESRRRNDDANRTAVRQIEHQSSLRSLISSSDVDSREMEEEILRQIREEGLLDGIDLENIDVNQEDQISERIAEAFRRRQRERAEQVDVPEPRNRSPSDRSEHRSGTSSRTRQSTTTQPPMATARRLPHSRSLSAASQADEATRASPRTSATRLEPHSSDEGRRRRRTASGGDRSTRSATSPAPSSSPVTRPAARSATDLTERSTSSHIFPTRPLMSVDTRSTTEPVPTSSTVADVVELATSRRRPPTLPPRSQVAGEAEIAASPVELQSSHSRTASQAPAYPPPPVPAVATQQDSQPGLIPAATLSHHSTATERAGALQAVSRPTSSESTASQRVSLPRFPEPSIQCNRCHKQHIEYELHYSCTICARGEWNVCLGCYRSGRGCEHWFGFGYAAWAKWEKARVAGHIPLNAEKPHMLFAERYLPPRITPGGAEGRRTLTTEDPARRLQSGAFCANCLEWANECYWRCDSCNEGDWGFCNNCVNQGRCCTHTLLPLLHKPDNRDAEPMSPSHDHQTPRSATLLTGPGVVELGSFKPLSFRVECDACHYPIQPTQTRFHCFQCTSALPGREAGDYDLCTTCYHSMVNKKRISNENGHLGWRRCLQGHRMIIVGFEDARGGQRRVVVQDRVGGRGLFEEPAKTQDAVDAGLQQWSWAEGTRARLVANNVASTAPTGNPAMTREFPPDGGVGMRAVALWSWYPKEGEGANELLFPRGAEVREVVDVNGDWFHGSFMGTKGLFPAPYVRVLDSAS
ncbi:hypothetical protein V498_02939 [Pseudogymnoascus sp. VKM F-4517 (FW-2822)]|nr:hypothetical protein V498_02939 [Pseudogymnoascus sp. VKM F-4517 (FW-2822)]